jgi:hypothetical protein
MQNCEWRGILHDKHSASSSASLAKDPPPPELYTTSPCSWSKLSSSSSAPSPVSGFYASKKWKHQTPESELRARGITNWHETATGAVTILLTTLDEAEEEGGERARQGTAVGCSSSSRSLLSGAPRCRWWWPPKPARRGRGCSGTAAGGAARARPGLWIAAPLMVTRDFARDVEEGACSERNGSEGDKQEED